MSLCSGASAHHAARVAGWPDPGAGWLHATWRPAAAQTRLQPADRTRAVDPDGVDHPDAKRFGRRLNQPRRPLFPACRWAHVRAGSGLPANARGRERDPVRMRRTAASMKGWKHFAEGRELSQGPPDPGEGGPAARVAGVAGPSGPSPGLAGNRRATRCSEKRKAGRGPPFSSLSQFNVPIRKDQKDMLIPKSPIQLSS